MFGSGFFRPDRGHPPLSDLVFELLTLARAESNRLGHEYLGCEHLGMALIHDASHRAALQRLGVDAEQAKRLFSEAVQVRNGGTSPAAELPLTSRTKKVFEYATVSARSLGHPFTGVEDLMVGLLQERLNIAAQVLLASGLREDDVNEQAKRA